MSRFGNTQFEDADKKMNKLRQTCNFWNYLKEFEKLVNCLPHWHPRAPMGTLISGLKSEITSELKMGRPHDLEETIELTTRKEEQLKSYKNVVEG